ncbi:MAG: hypothetical protein H6636_11010 [Anaerolineales bacterium]|nr:hypothetical protein [Anaerolineales bacterium]
MSRVVLFLGSLSLLAGLILSALIPAQTATALEPDNTLPAIIFVARAHLATPDDIFGDELGPAGQFGTGLPKYAPGSKLIRRDPDGSLFVYNTPGLVDLQSPDVNFDGTKIIFSGATTLIAGTTNSGWRLYEINVDGTGFHQLTFSDREITIPNADLWGNQETYGTYNDLFPAYLADGHIAFVSTRYPTRAHYDERAGTNLYIVNGDGSNLHRVTTERAGLLHPTPLPDGRILLTRWWNQFNQPSNQGIYNRVDNADFTQTLADGTVIFANSDAPFNPANGILPGGTYIRDAPNTWHLMVVNPDGTDFKRYAWTPAFPWAATYDSGHDTYQATQPAVILNNGQIFVAFTSQADGSMVHSTQHTGIRIARPGLDMLYANTFDALVGQTIEQTWNGEDTTVYALHPWGLPDGTILYSQSSEDNSLPTNGQYTEGAHIFDLQGSNLRYQLYTMNLDGSSQTLLPVNLTSVGLGTADVMDAKPIVARVGWTALPDQYTATPTDNPVEWNVPNSLAAYWFSNNGLNDIETATVHNPNVYANASLYAPFVNNSPPPGSVAFAQLWIDANQFTGAYCYNDWPDPCAGFEWDNQVRAVLWDETPVTLQGAFTMTVPADVMGFFVLRDAEHNVVREWNRGYISIAQGSAWARAGETVTCVGCHMGHVSGSLDDVMDEVEQGWTNVAPYATVTASSYRYNDGEPDYQPFTPNHINDRRGWVPLPEGGPVLDPEEPYIDNETGWLTEDNQAVGEWVELRWPTKMLVKSIRLVGPPPNGGDWGGFGDPAQFGDYYVEGGTLHLFLNGIEVDSLAVGRVEPLENGGTLLVLDAPIEIDQLRFTVEMISGSWYWQEVAALNEIEVNGMAGKSWPLLEILQVFLPSVRR